MGRPTLLSAEDEAEAAELSRALALVKDLISAINAEVREYELRMRLYDVYRRVDGRAKLQLRADGRPGSGNDAGSGCATFGRDELLRRKLLHSGCVLWKTAAGRFKGGGAGSRGAGSRGQRLKSHARSVGGVWGSVKLSGAQWSLWGSVELYGAATC